MVWANGWWEITISPRCLTECFPCCSCVRFWMAQLRLGGEWWLGSGLEILWGRGANPGGIRVCLLACLAEIRWLRRRARRDSATVERILTLINIYIFICAPFCVYFAAKFGPFRSLLIKSPLHCSTPMYVRISLDCWLLSGCPNSDCSLFNCQTI